MMDRITQRQLNSFKKKFQIETGRDEDNFELFAGYYIVAQFYDDEFEPSAVSCGGGGDYSIDTFAIVADGDLVTNMQELEALLEDRKKISDAKFIFIQTKTADSFDHKVAGELGNAVASICKGEELDGCNERIAEVQNMITSLFDSDKLSARNPDCCIYYVTAGNWQSPSQIVSRIKKVKNDLNDLNLFTNVEFHAYGAKELQKAYRLQTESNKCTLKLDKVIALPPIDGIKEAHVGYIDVIEYLKLISSDSGEIRKSAFYSNVRDFEGENEVNIEIKQTINETPSKFVLYNNGVTVICKEMNRRGQTFTLSDYQIVNGCQTSHIIHSCKDTLNSDLLISVKLIATDDDETIRNIIKASNRQTKIRDEQFISLNDFNKELEDFYAAFSDNERLYYERRSKQYSHTPDIEKVRIVTIPTQIKAIASMFYDVPHQATAYYGKLLSNFHLSIFDSKHKKEPYYLSAYLLYKLEFAFRNKQLPREHRKYRFHLLMVFKYKHIESNDLTANNTAKRCNALLITINNQDEFITLCREYIKLIINEIDSLMAADTNKQIEGQKTDPLKSIQLIEKIRNKCTSKKKKINKK